MTTAIVLVICLIALAAAYFGFRAWSKYRGARLITCPETHKPAGVEIDAGLAALTSIGAAPHLRLKSCTRWPEKKDCGQECLAQLESSPDNCLVRNILTQWYAGKTCIYCGKNLGEIDWFERKPALCDTRRKTVEWQDVPVETLPDVLATSQPVCWDCHIIETFRREHPDLVVDRGR
jgi:hypothetical protein